MVVSSHAPLKLSRLTWVCSRIFVCPLPSASASSFASAPPTTGPCFAISPASSPNPAFVRAVNLRVNARMSLAC